MCERLHIFLYFTQHGFRSILLYYAILLYILHSHLLAYTYHLEQEALLGSTPGS